MANPFLTRPICQGDLDRFHARPIGRAAILGRMSFVRTRPHPRKRSRSEAELYLAEEIFKSRLSRKRWYREVYLYSEHWEGLREEAFSTYGRHCAKCPSTTHLQVHHLAYRNIFDVTVQDLQVLCMKCHHKEHPEHGEAKTKKLKPAAKKKKKSRAKRLASKQKRKERFAAFGLENKLAEATHKFRLHPIPEAAAIRHLLRKFGYYISKPNHERLRKRRKAIEAEPLNYPHPMVHEASELDAAFLSATFAAM